MRAVLRTKRDEGFAIEEIEIRLPQRESVTPYPPLPPALGATLTKSRKTLDDLTAIAKGLGIDFLTTGAK